MDIKPDLSPDQSKSLDNEQVKINMKGGFLSAFGFGGDSLNKTIKRTKSSENQLINAYESMDEKIKEYQEAYDKHLTNLGTLDEFINFKGMEMLFKKVIIKSNFKNGQVDRSLPILFRNYLIEDEVTPSVFRREHILRQVEYVLSKHFPGREHMFIKYKNVVVGKKEFVLNITTIENVKKSRTIKHTNYVIDFAETKAALKDILSVTKKNLKRTSTIVDLNNSSNVSTKPKRRVKKTKISNKISNNASNGSRTIKKSNISNATNSGTLKRTSPRSRIKLSGKSELSNNKAESKPLDLGFEMIDLGNNSKNTKKPKSNIAAKTNEIAKSNKPEKLSMFMTNAERKARNAARAPPPSPIATPGIVPGGIMPIGAPMMAPPGLDQKRADLASLVPGAMGLPTTTPSNSPMDPEDARCGAIPAPATKEVCNAQGCWIGQGGKCIKRGTPSPRAGAPGGFGAFGSPATGAPGGFGGFGMPAAAPTPAAF